MSFRQWRHYLESIFKIEVWSDHANFKQFMSQTVLNDHQACWLIQLTSYDFTIQYCQGSLNPADESSWKPDYMQTEQNKRCYESNLILISSEKHYESSFKQFQSMSTQSSNSSSISAEDKLTFWQIDDLISILVNKLATAMLRAGGQYSCCIRKTDPETECLIWVLSLQVTT